MPLQLESAIAGTTVSMTMAGELDANSAPEVRKVIDTSLTGSTERLVLHLEKLNFMASAGLRILIFARQKQPNLKVILIKPQETIIDTLKKTGFYQSVYILQDEAGLAAVA